MDIYHPKFTTLVMSVAMHIR